MTLLQTHVWAKPLTEQDVRQARRIAIFPGTFDPFTNGHLASAQAVLDSGKADLVILTPGGNPLKSPMPSSIRLSLIDAALSEHAKIAYPYGPTLGLGDSSANLSAWIKQVNPEAKVLAVMGTDVANSPVIPFMMSRRLKAESLLVLTRQGYKLGAVRSPVPYEVITDPQTLSGFSSSEIKKYFSQNVELYFTKNRSLEKLPPGIDKAVAEQIFSNGIYLSNLESNKIPLHQALLSKVKNKAFQVGLYDIIRKLIVLIKARPNIKQVEIGGQVIQIEKYLGSGIYADVYTIKYNGEEAVVKIAKDTVKGRRALLRSIPVHRWIQERTNIIVPDVYAYDTEGRWMVSELVNGLSLDKTPNPGTLPKEVRDMYDEALRLKNSSGIKLDLSADNIFLRDGQPVLVDFDPIPESNVFPENYSTFERRILRAMPKLSEDARCGLIYQELGSRR